MFFDLMESLHLLERRVAAVRKVQPLHVLHGEMRVYKVCYTALLRRSRATPLCNNSLIFPLQPLHPLSPPLFHSHLPHSSSPLSKCPIIESLGSLANA